MPESYKSKYKWILTVIDHCTLWPVAVQMIEATAVSIADALLEHVITPFGLPKEVLTDRGANFLLKGLSQFLKAGRIKKLNTSGYHPRTNGKNERYNGILKNAIFKLNKTGDLLHWEDFLLAVLFSTCIHVSDSSGFSPFELTYGVKPCLPGDSPAMIAAKPAAPGEHKLRAWIAELNVTRAKALGRTADQANQNKSRFNQTTNFTCGLERFVVGQSVKLRNESHTKGAARFFGPFEVKKVLDNNVYILVDQNGKDYSCPVNGNDLQPVSLQSLICNDMWSTPPAVAQKAKRAEAWVERATLQKAKAITTVPAPTTSRFLVKFGGKFLWPPASGPGTAPS
jgi:hypothetical protein